MVISTIWLDIKPADASVCIPLVGSHRPHCHVQEFVLVKITASSHICVMMEAAYPGAITGLQILLVCISCFDSIQAGCSKLVGL